MRFEIGNLKFETQNFRVVFWRSSPEFRSDISNLKSLAESISRQLRSRGDSLQNSKIKGQRYLDNQARQTMQNCSGT
ncbi:MAG: hypothetical protein DMG06_29690 [Acidobacteria bacterium]|nr:MAG: hypothetical protein DMG06_29690 [Acidobacteriota bacterium]